MDTEPAEMSHRSYPPSHLNPPRLSPALVGRLMRATTPLHTVEGPPVDCVLRSPTLAPDVVEMVGYDLRGKPRILVQVDANEDVEEFQRAILRWMRRNYKKWGLYRSLELIG